MDRSSLYEFENYISQQRHGQPPVDATGNPQFHRPRRTLLDIFRRSSTRGVRQPVFRDPLLEQSPEMLIEEAEMAGTAAQPEPSEGDLDPALTQMVPDQGGEPLPDAYPEESSQERDMAVSIEDQVAQHFRESLVAMVNDSVVMMEDMVSSAKATIVNLKEHRTLVIGQSDAHLATIDENRELVNRQIDSEVAGAEQQIEALKQHITNLRESRKLQNADFDTLKNRAQSKRHDDLELVDRMIVAEEVKLDALITPKSGSTEIEHQKQARQPTKGKPALVKSEQVDMAQAEALQERAAVG
ncbi:MAG TPA: hypothetical protein VL418_07300 [Devosiaceae bacterium]|jgi:hypothetical protein|nr:hypothetical protein [Devosiaceae bacterium]